MKGFDESRSAPWRALARFHAGAGARAALRAGTAGVAVVIFAFGSAPEPAYLLMTCVLGLVGRPEPVAWAGAPGARAALGLGAAALAALGARRVTLGARGWAASLPAARATNRRAAWAGATLAAFPAAAFALAAIALAPTLYRAAPDPARVAGLPLLFAAAGALALGVEGRGARALAALAFALAAWGTWPALAAGAGALLAWDRAAGGVAPPGVRRRTRRDAADVAAPANVAEPTGGPARAAVRPGARRAAAPATLARWAWRALGWRAAADALPPAALPVAFCAFVRANNPDLAPGTAAWVARLGAGLGVTLAVVTLAARLLARRAPWAWARALPWSAAERVAADAVALGAPALVVVGGASALALGGGGALVAAASAALVVAPAAAGALRAGAARQTGAAGEALVAGVLWSVLAAVRPAFTLGAPLAALALGSLAVRRERRSAGAVRWNELRHDPAGDALWLSRP